jgi:deoxyribodipyrimidine photo-lyase
VAVFARSDRQWREHDWGAPKADFVLRSVVELSASLESLRIPLIIIEAPGFGDVPGALLEKATQLRCDALFFNREYEVNERRRDDAVVAAFETSGRTVRTFDDQAVLAPGTVLTNGGSAYTVFTPFKRRWLEVYEDARPTPLGIPKRQATLVTPPSKVDVRLMGFPGEARPDKWPARERHAHTLLQKFFERRIDDYNDRRDFPAEEGTSTLSPYLSAGVISARECLHAAIKANGGERREGRPGVLTWISELIWREFYRHVLVGFPRVCMNRAFIEAADAIRWDDDDAHFAAWCEGRTGVPIVDAGMRQLRETGWMHNRVRMIVAMFLTKDLLIDWRRGERYFMNHLVDADFASNNGGWQWAASTGTDAAPYFRIFNPFTQSRRFDTGGAYIRRYVPELAALDDDALHEPHRGGRRLGVDYPKPIVDHAEARERAIATFARAMRPRRR